MADAPLFLLAYDGFDYPVTLSQPPVVQTINYIVSFKFLGADPFLSGYDGSGFVITEYQDGTATGNFTFYGGTVTGSGPSDYYIADGNASVTPGFDGFVPCFAQDTLIATPTGPIAVQDLVKDTLVTTTVGLGRVVWLGRRRVRDTDVIRIRRGTLGATRDLIVSDDHALFLDGVLVPAGLLADGVGIVRERVESVTLYHVELERHAILLADGVEAESYIDTGNRRQFGNCPIGYDPVSATQDHCAELVVAGARLEAIRARLALVPA